MCASGRNLCIRTAISTLLVIHFKMNCFILWTTASKAAVSEQDILNGKCISCSFQPVISLFLSTPPLHCCCGQTKPPSLLSHTSAIICYSYFYWLSQHLLNSSSLLSDLRDSVNFCTKKEVEPVVECSHQPGMIPTSSRGIFSVVLAWGFLNFFTKRFSDL